MYILVVVCNVLYQHFLRVSRDCVAIFRRIPFFVVLLRSHSFAARVEQYRMTYFLSRTFSDIFMPTECCVPFSFSSFSIIISTFFQRSFSFIFGWHFVWSSNGRQGRRLTVVFYPGFLVELFRFGVASGSSSKLSFVSGDSRRPSLSFRIPFESVYPPKKKNFVSMSRGASPAGYRVVELF